MHYLKHIYVNYYLLIMRMDVTSSKNEVALKNLNALCDVEFILRLPYILLVLECVCACIDQNYTKQGCVCVILWSPLS